MDNQLKLNEIHANIIDQLGAGLVINQSMLLNIINDLNFCEKTSSSIYEYTIQLYKIARLIKKNVKENYKGSDNLDHLDLETVMNELFDNNMLNDLITKELQRQLYLIERDDVFHQIIKECL